MADALRPPGGRGVERVALSRPQRPLVSPRREKPGHAPPPPRPFGRFGSNVAVIANRLERGLSHPRPLLADIFLLIDFARCGKRGNLNPCRSVECATESAQEVFTGFGKGRVQIKNTKLERILAVGSRSDRLLRNRMISEALEDAGYQGCTLHEVMSSLTESIH